MLDSLGGVEAGELFDDTEDEAAENGAGNAAESADHRRRKGLQSDVSHVCVHEGHRCQEYSGQRRHRGRDGPDQRVHALYRDAAITRCKLVL